MSQRSAIEREARLRAERQRARRQWWNAWLACWALMVLGAVALLAATAGWAWARAQAPDAAGARASLSQEQERLEQTQTKAQDAWADTVGRTVSVDAAVLRSQSEQLREQAQALAAGHTGAFEDSFAQFWDIRVGGMFDPQAQDVQVALTRSDHGRQEYLVSYRIAPRDADATKGLWVELEAAFGPDGVLEPVHGRWLEGTPLGR